MTRRSLVVLLVTTLTAGVTATSVAEDRVADGNSYRDWDHLSDDWGGARTRLEDRGLYFEVAYTGDFVDNTIGGLDTGAVVLGNLDMTFALHTWELLPVDLGTLFVYGLYDHGGNPTALVGDLQGTDNIEAPTTAKLYEIWWQRAFFKSRMSVLGGLYDVNSEFYVVESAELFINSSFGIGPEVSLSGLNGPSIFPNTSLAFRLKAEPIRNFEISAAVMEGTSSDPNQPTGTQIQFDPGEGIFFIAEVARYWTRRGTETNAADAADGVESLENPAKRRRVGRTLAQAPYFLTVKLGTWLYSSPQPDLATIAATGQAATQTGHPGVYLTAEFDATKYSLLDVGGLAAFVQLGFADGRVAPFAGYTGAGFIYTGLVPTRPDDSLGIAVAAGYAGSGLEATQIADGEVPAIAEVALEFTYRVYPVRWLSVQTDLQYVIHPGALENRPNALVLGIRYVIDF